MQNNYINTQEHLVFWTVLTAEFKHCTHLTKLKEFILCFSWALNSKPQIVLRLIVSSSFGMLCREIYSAFLKTILYLGFLKLGSRLKYITMTQVKFKGGTLLNAALPFYPQQFLNATRQLGQFWYPLWSKVIKIIPTTFVINSRDFKSLSLLSFMMETSHNP